MRLPSRNAHGIKDTAALAENHIHLLETAIGRLRVEEVHRGENGGVDDGEDDIRLVADAREGDRGDHHDHEIPDPVPARGHRVRWRADPQGHDLGGVKPGHAQPADGEEGVEDEEEDGGCDARVGRADGIRDGQDDHAPGHARGTEQHQLPPAEPLDGEDGDPGGGEVFGPVAGGDETREEIGEADLALQDGGDVVGDQIDPGDLLEHLVDVREHDAVEVAVLGHGEEVAEVALGHLHDRCLDHDEFVLDVRVVLGDIAQRGEHGPGFVLAALEDEPPGGFGERHDETQDHGREEDLEGDGEPPGDGVGVQEGEAQVDPVGDHDPACDHRAFDHDQHAPAVGARAFRLPGRDRGGVDPVTEPRHPASDDQLGQGEGGALEDGADDHDGGAEEDGAPSAEHVADPYRGDGAGKTAEIVGGDGDTCEGQSELGDSVCKNAANLVIAIVCK